MANESIADGPIAEEPKPEKAPKTRKAGDAAEATSETAPAETPMGPVTTKWRQPEFEDHVVETPEEAAEVGYYGRKPKKPDYSQNNAAVLHNRPTHEKA